MARIQKRRKRAYENLVKKLESFQSNHIFRLRFIGDTKDRKYKKRYRMYRLDFNKIPKKIHVCLSAGAHGDETNGVDILLKFLKKHRNDEEYLRNFEIISFITSNPLHYEYGDVPNRGMINRWFMRTDKEMLEIRNIKKSLSNESIDLFLDMHGDIDKNGFYCYERRFDKRLSIGRNIVDSVSKAYKINEDRKIYNDQNSNGVIFVDGEYREGSFEEFIFHKGAKFSLTIEYPGKLLKRDRIRCGVMAIEAALESYRKQRREIEKVSG